VKKNVVRYKYSLWIIVVVFSRALIEGEQLKLNRIFFDERWSKHRTVTSLDWSMQVGGRGGGSSGREG